MESVKKETTKRAKSAKAKYRSIRAKLPTGRKLDQILKKCNKKLFGKSVKPDAVLDMALDLIEDKHIENLQQQSLTNADKLKMKYREHIKKFGDISMDEFLGTLLGGDSDNSNIESVTNPQASFA